MGLRKVKTDDENRRIQRAHDIEAQKQLKQIHLAKLMFSPNQDSSKVTGPTMSNTDKLKSGSNLSMKQSQTEYNHLNATIAKTRKISPEDAVISMEKEYESPDLLAKQKRYQSHAVIQDVNNSDEEKSSTEIQNQNKTANNYRRNLKNKRTRYNPMRDPNFNLNSPEFINQDRRNSGFTKSQLQEFDNILQVRFQENSPSPEVLDETDIGDANEIPSYAEESLVEREQKVFYRKRYHPGKNSQT